MLWGLVLRISQVELFTNGLLPRRTLKRVLYTPVESGSDAVR